MAADFNKPTITGDAYVDVLGEIRAQFEVVSTMSYGDALNTKVGAVQFLDGSLQKWSGSSFNVVPVSITGGGTGASTAAGARTALNVNEKGTLGAQVRSNAESDALYVPQSRTITTAGALNGGNSLDSNISLTVDSATTSQQGVVQLFNGVNSTSTTQALTAAQGKALNDKVAVLEDKHLFETVWSGSATTVSDSMIKAQSGGSTIGSGLFVIYTLQGGSTERLYSVNKYLQTDNQTCAGDSRVNGNVLSIVEWGGGSKRFEVKTYDMASNTYGTSETIIQILRKPF